MTKYLSKAKNAKINENFTVNSQGVSIFMDTSQ